MAGTAKGYDISQIHQGPGDIWIIGTPPADSATPQLTLATDGTPDATTHPLSVCLGMTKGGITTTAKQKISDIVVDQFTAPVEAYLDADEVTLEAEMTQQGVDQLQYAYSTSVYTTATAYKQITGGGISVIPTFAVAAITPKRTGSALWIVTILFRVASKGGFSVIADRTKPSMHKLQFTGQSDIGRTAGRQIFVHYETK